MKEAIVFCMIGLHDYQPIYECAVFICDLCISDCH